jgi:hypothetical protein
MLFKTTRHLGAKAQCSCTKFSTMSMVNTCTAVAVKAEPPERGEY